MKKKSQPGPKYNAVSFVRADDDPLSLKRVMVVDSTAWCSDDDWKALENFGDAGTPRFRVLAALEELPAFESSPNKHVIENAKHIRVALSRLMRFAEAPPSHPKADEWFSMSDAGHEEYLTRYQQWKMETTNPTAGEIADLDLVDQLWKLFNTYLYAVPSAEGDMHRKQQLSDFGVKGNAARVKYSDAMKRDWRDIAATLTHISSKRRRAEIIAERKHLPPEAVESIRKAI